MLRRVHRGLRTARLYEELASGFDTYVEARRHRAEGSEARAVRSLQVYGAAFAAVATGATIMQALGEPYLKTGGDQVLALVSLLVVGLGVLVSVNLWLRRRDRRVSS
jgi:hypothetical protein